MQQFAITSRFVLLKTCYGTLKLLSGYSTLPSETDAEKGRRKIIKLMAAMVGTYQELRLFQTPRGSLGWSGLEELTLLATGEAARRRGLDRRVRCARAERLVVARWGGELKERMTLTASGSVRSRGRTQLITACSRHFLFQKQKQTRSCRAEPLGFGLFGSTS